MEKLLGILENHPKSQCLVEGRSVVGVLPARNKEYCGIDCHGEDFGMMLHDTERHCRVSYQIMV